jgi:hypothetical protein
MATDFSKLNSISDIICQLLLPVVDLPHLDPTITIAIGASQFERLMTILLAFYSSSTIKHLQEVMFIVTFLPPESAVGISGE